MAVSPERPNLWVVAMSTRLEGVECCEPNEKCPQEDCRMLSFRWYCWRIRDEALLDEVRHGDRLWCFVTCSLILFSLRAFPGWRVSVIPLHPNCKAGLPLLLPCFHCHDGPHPRWNKGFCHGVLAQGLKTSCYSPEDGSDQLMLMRRARGKIAKEAWVIASREMYFLFCSHARDLAFSLLG